MKQTRNGSHKNKINAKLARKKEERVVASKPAFVS